MSYITNRNIAKFGILTGFLAILSLIFPWANTYGLGISGYPWYGIDFLMNALLWTAPVALIISAFVLFAIYLKDYQTFRFEWILKILIPIVLGIVCFVDILYCVGASSKIIENDFSAVATGGIGSNLAMLVSIMMIFLGVMGIIHVFLNDAQSVSLKTPKVTESVCNVTTSSQNKGNKKLTTKMISVIAVAGILVAGCAGYAAGDTPDNVKELGYVNYFGYEPVFSTAVNDYYHTMYGTSSFYLGDEITIYDEPFNSTIKNLTFINWNTKEDGSGTSYEAGEIISPHESLTLYAQYRELTMIDSSVGTVFKYDVSGTAEYLGDIRNVSGSYKVEIVSASHDKVESKITGSLSVGFEGISLNETRWYDRSDFLPSDETVYSISTHYGTKDVTINTINTSNSERTSESKEYRGVGNYIMYRSDIFANDGEIQLSLVTTLIDYVIIQ